MVTNAGGINTPACAAALTQACKKAGVDLRVAAVQGDDLMPKRDQLMEAGNVSGELHRDGPSTSLRFH